MKFLRFLSYHNAVPVAISLMLLGAGGAYAAGNPEEILSAEETVLTIDNTYIVSKDLSSYTPRVEITGVTEDEENYYVSYNFSTIDLREYAWRDHTRQERMVVAKKGLEGDLGLYVTGRLRDVISHERSYLAEVQAKERQAVTQQTVVTTYGGLVGRFLDATTETLPGYTPVIAPPVPEVAAAPRTEITSSSGGPAAVASSGGSTEGSTGSQPSVVAETRSAPSVVASSGSVGTVTLQVLGNNPARIPLRSTYVDLGVVMLDPAGTNLGLHTFLNGHETTSPNIDTSVAAIHTVEYRVTDASGASISTTRTVIVGEPVPSSATSTPQGA